MEVSPFKGDWLFEPNWFHTKYNTMKKLENMMDYAAGLDQQLSPEIHQFISLITARREELGVVSRAFWTPDVFFNGEIQNRVYRGGAGKKFR